MGCGASAVKGAGEAATEWSDAQGPVLTERLPTGHALPSGDSATRAGTAVESDDESVSRGKIESLAHRGFTIQSLVDFMRELWVKMPHFDFMQTKTVDVVWQVIIPGSAAQGCAYAEIMSGGKRVLPQKMVTHNWGNRFADLIAAVFADALGLPDYAQLVPLLMPGRLSLLEAMLRDAGQLGATRWMCIFCVNQHISICNATWDGKDTTTGTPYAPCPCGRPKIHAGAACEMNKFDPMIEYMKVNQLDGIVYRHLMAADAEVYLCRRIWVIAELAMILKLGISLDVSLRAADIDPLLRASKAVDVREARASRPEDEELILNKIPDKDHFNSEVRFALLKVIKVMEATSKSKHFQSEFFKDRFIWQWCREKEGGEGSDSEDGELAPKKMPPEAAAFLNAHLEELEAWKASVHACSSEEQVNDLPRCPCEAFLEESRGGDWWCDDPLQTQMITQASHHAGCGDMLVTRACLGMLDAERTSEDDYGGILEMFAMPLKPVEITGNAELEVRIASRPAWQTLFVLRGDRSFLAAFHGLKSLPGDLQTGTTVMLVREGPARTLVAYKGLDEQVAYGGSTDLDSGGLEELMAFMASEGVAPALFGEFHFVTALRVLPPGEQAATALLMVKLPSGSLRAEAQRHASLFKEVAAAQPSVRMVFISEQSTTAFLKPVKSSWAVDPTVDFVATGCKESRHIDLTEMIEAVASTELVPPALVLAKPGAPLVTQSFVDKEMNQSSVAAFLQ